jgi:predicted dehydrogenase
MSQRIFVILTSLVVAMTTAQAVSAKEGEIRIGIVGCDTSHVMAFTKLINDPKATGPFADAQVTVAYPGGSSDIPDSYNRLPKYVKELKDAGVKIVDSLEELASESDAVLLESLDGRPKPKQFRAIAKGKPVFVDKPAAASLAELLTMFRVADETHTPVFTSSSLRFGEEVQNATKDKSIGEILGCETLSPMSTEKHHPDLFWYGIHGVEPLFTLMGSGCETVSRTDSKETTVVVGKWKDGRIGTYRGLKKGYYYAFSLFGVKGVLQRAGSAGYEPLVTKICEFFKSGNPPVDRAETIEIYAFMEAADESKRQGGKPVTISDVLRHAEQTAKGTSTSSSSGGRF